MKREVSVGAAATLGSIWACLEAAGQSAERHRRAPRPVWDMACVEIREAQELLERIDPDAPAVQAPSQVGDVVELVRRALDLLDLVDPYELGVEAISLRVRVRWIERLIAPDGQGDDHS